MLWGITLIESILQDCLSLDAKLQIIEDGQLSKKASG